MVNNPVNVEELGSGIGTKRAAAAIAFRDAVERRGAKTVGKHMEKIIDDCQVAWVAASESITSTSPPEAGKVHANGVMLRIGFTTALMATRNFAAIDLSENKYIGFWIRSDITVAANMLQLVLSRSAACASLDVRFDLPILVAGVWSYIRFPIIGGAGIWDAIISVGLYALNSTSVPTLISFDDIRAGNEYLGVADEMQDKDAYAQHDPVHIIDQGKVEVGLAGTALSGQYLDPVGNGKFAVSTNGVAGQDGMKTLNSRMVAVEDQATENGTVPARMV